MHFSSLLWSFRLFGVTESAVFNFLWIMYQVDLATVKVFGLPLCVKFLYWFVFVLESLTLPDSRNSWTDLLSPRISYPAVSPAPRDTSESSLITANLLCTIKTLKIKKPVSLSLGFESPVITGPRSLWHFNSLFRFFTLMIVHLHSRWTSYWEF